MNRLRYRAIPAACLALAAGLVLAACASRGGTGGDAHVLAGEAPAQAAPALDQAAAPHHAAPPHHENHATASNHEAHAAPSNPDGHALPATAGPGYTVADVRFMQDMIGHHAQALTMAAMAPTHGAGPMLLRLAEKIDISQRDEIAMMRRWLAERNQVVPPADLVHPMLMPGMLTPQQLARLDAARGEAFDRLFLTLMIQHHIGALRMVETLFASPGAAQDSEIFRFVSDVAADQGDEIAVMQSMLDMLAATPGSRSR